MNTIDDAGHDDRRQDADALWPLPGEAGIPSVAAPVRVTLSRKGLLAAGLFVVTLAVVSALWIDRLVAGGRKGDDAASRLAGNRPAAATVEPRRIELPAPRTPASAPASAPAVRIPAIVPTADELAEPIGVRRGPAPVNPAAKAIPPEDAPVMLVTSRPAAATTSTDPRLSTAGSVDASSATSPGADALTQTRRNLETYQRQLQRLLDGMERGAEGPAQGPGPSSGQASAAGPASTAGAFPGTAFPPVRSSTPLTGTLGEHPPGAATPRVAATTIGDRSLTLPKGTVFTCALKTRIVSATSGLVGCQVQRNVYGDDGRVLLVERGSHLDGEYRVASLRPGTIRIPVVWTRLRTPHGVSVDIESPAIGALGESGIDGHVDNRWPERLGAAMLLSLIDDSVKLVIQHQAGQGDGSGGNTVVLPSTTANTSKLAEKVLDSTINIPPLIHRNQGGIVGIHVARDVDFSTVYALRRIPRETAPAADAAASADAAR